MKTTLTSKTVAELKEMAKELEVKNWWTLKKAELIDQIWDLQNKKVPSKVIPVGGGLGLEIIDDDDDDDEEPILTLGELAYEYKFKTTKTRRILRDHNFNKNKGRWEWFEGDEGVIEEIKVVLDKYVKEKQ